MIKNQTKITTKQAISLLRLINKMEIKEILVEGMGELANLEKEKKTILKELYKKLPEGEEITKTVTEKLLLENEEISERFAHIQTEGGKATLNLIFDIICAVPNAEKDFYKTVAEIEGLAIKEVEEMAIEDSATILLNVFQSSSFMGFFKSIKK